MSTDKRMNTRLIAISPNAHRPVGLNQLTEESRSCFMRGPDFTSDTLRVPSSSLQLEIKYKKAHESLVPI